MTIEECATKILCFRINSKNYDVSVSINDLVDDSVACAKRIFAKCQEKDNSEKTAKELMQGKVKV